MRTLRAVCRDSLNTERPLGSLLSLLNTLPAVCCHCPDIDICSFLLPASMTEGFLPKLDVHSQKILQSCVWVPEDHPFFISVDPSSDVTIQRGRAPDITKPTSPSSVPRALSSAPTPLKIPLLSDTVLSVWPSALSFCLSSWATRDHTRAVCSQTSITMSDHTCSAQ